MFPGILLPVATWTQTYLCVTSSVKFSSCSLFSSMCTYATRYLPWCHWWDRCMGKSVEANTRVAVSCHFLFSGITLQPVNVLKPGLESVYRNAIMHCTSQCSRSQTNCQEVHFRAPHRTKLCKLPSVLPWVHFMKEDGDMEDYCELESLPFSFFFTHA